MLRAITIKGGYLPAGSRPSGKLVIKDSKGRYNGIGKELKKSQILGKSLCLASGLRTYTEEFGESVRGFFSTYGLGQVDLPACRDPAAFPAGLSDFELFTQHCTFEQGGKRYLVGDAYEDAPCFGVGVAEFLRPR